MSCLNVKIKAIINPLSLRVNINQLIEPIITADFKQLNVSVHYISNTFKPIISISKEELIAYTSLKREFNVNCSLVCSTSIVGGVRYVYVEPEYLWLASSDLLSGDVVITSNTVWEIT